MTKADPRRMELLSPAGSPASLMAAFRAGADAVYMGGPLFGARAFAQNPEGEALFQALDYAHLRQKKVYLTVNTLLKEGELEEQLFDYLSPMVKQGLDGVIVQDMGVLAFLRGAFPGLPLHASTQMAVSGPQGARLLKERGVKRLVLPRELSLGEIETISREGGLETEVFVHGALCYCWSGRCLMSSFLGGRSGNRGRCAQPCRLPYAGGRMMNMRDLCGLDELPALQAAGVTSLKIEGRMKSPEYTAGVTAIYRKYLDRLEEGAFQVEAEDRRALSALFDRGGFTTGYYRLHNGPSMLDTGEKKTHVSLSEAEKSRLQETYLGARPLEVSGHFFLKQGEKARLTLSRGSRRVIWEGPPAQPALKQPLSAERLQAQLRKSGNSGFVFNELTVETDGASFLPLGAVNEMRRQALEKLQEALLAPCRGEEGIRPTVRRRQPMAPHREADYPALPLRVQLDDIRLLEAVLAFPLEGIYLPADYVAPEALAPLTELIHRAGKKAYYAMPPVFRPEIIRIFEEKKAIEALGSSALDGVLLASLEAVGFWREKGLPGEMIFDHSLYGWNHRAQEEMEALGAACLTLPLELHEKDLAALGPSPLPREQLIYGRVPLMVSAKCLLKTRNRCLKVRGEAALRFPEWENLTDRTGASHPCQARCRHCHSVLYNAVPLYLADQPLYGDRLRIHFTTETGQEAESFLGHIVAGLKKGDKAALTPPNGIRFTRGNYRKGVE